MDFVRNAWYVACWSHELVAQPLARTILGEPVVLFRGADGAPAALEDRCPHRYLPLSLGRPVEAGLQCGYHGMTFDARGACVAIPGQTRIPPNARVRAYPVRETNGMVWIWTGVPALAETVPVYDQPEFQDPGWTVAYGTPLEYCLLYTSDAADE